MNHLPPVLIINLLRRPERFINVIQQLNRVGLGKSTIRIQATDEVEARQTVY